MALYQQQPACSLRYSVCFCVVDGSSASHWWQQRYSPGSSSRNNNSIGDADSEVCFLLQDLQTDLHAAMRLEKRSAEYQLAVYMGAGSQYVKHRDALPDDGADPNQRRVGPTSFWCSCHRTSCTRGQIASAFKQSQQQSNKSISSQHTCINK